MRIAVDRSRCTGLGLCEAQAPDLFDVQDDGSLLVRDEHPGEERRTDLMSAVAGCPTQALSIIDE